MGPFASVPDAKAAPWPAAEAGENGVPFSTTATGNQYSHAGFGQGPADPWADPFADPLADLFAELKGPGSRASTPASGEEPARYLNDTGTGPAPASGTAGIEAAAGTNTPTAEVGRPALPPDEDPSALTQVVGGLDGSDGTAVSSQALGAGPEASPSRSVLSADRQRFVESFGRSRLSFEPNRGQAASQAQFVGRGRGYTVLLAPTQATLALSRRLGPTLARPVLRLQLVGANPAAAPSALEPLPGKVHYLVGRNPGQWQRDVPTYGRVAYRNVYPGIDVAYYGTARQQLEFDFKVAPRANPAAIRLQVQGAGSLRVDGQGRLVLPSPAGDVVQGAPVAYQLVGGVRQPVPARFVLLGTNQVGFQLGAYDPSRPVVIDPVVFYSGYLGGAGDDEGYAIAVGSDGSAYVGGGTYSASFDPGTGLGSSLDGFITRLNPDGSLAYTLIGGGALEDEVRALAVGTNGLLYATGYTKSTDLPPVNAYQGSNGGGSDAFVYVLDPVLVQVTYQTYLGGPNNEEGLGIAVGRGAGDAGVAYVTGVAAASLPNTQGVLQGSFVGGPSDAFVAKLDPAGSAAPYVTYLAGSGEDVGAGIAVDGAGNAYVTGKTASADFPFVSGVPASRSGVLQGTYGGGPYDAFVAALSPTGSGLVYWTYLGGSHEDQGAGIALDGAQNAYVAGGTRSSNFVTTSGAYDQSHGGGTCGTTPVPCADTFVTKLNAAGTARVYSTFLGGPGDDEAAGIALNGSNNAYVTGRTGPGAGFPTTANAPQAGYGGGAWDAFVTELETGGGGLVYSTYLGLSGDDEGKAIAVDGWGSAYVSGITTSNEAIAGSPFQSTNHGQKDAFVAKIGPALPPPVAANDAYSLPHGSTLSVPAAGVLANDSDPLSLPLYAVLFTPPAYGTVQLQPDGSFIYQADDPANMLPDSFT